MDLRASLSLISYPILLFFRVLLFSIRLLVNTGQKIASVPFLTFFDIFLLSFNCQQNLGWLVLNHFRWKLYITEGHNSYVTSPLNLYSFLLLRLCVGFEYWKSKRLIFRTTTQINKPPVYLCEVSSYLRRVV